jgi:hypothetical protein
MTATNQFEYILKVLRSSKTEGQLITSVKMFENFKSNWENKLECFDMLNFIYSFYNEKTKILSNILRK